MAFLRHQQPILFPRPSLHYIPLALPKGILNIKSRAGDISLSTKIPKWAITPSAIFGWGTPRNEEPLSYTVYHNNIPIPFPPSLLARTFLAGKELKCCYRATEDGFSAMSFHKYCDFKGPCVIVGFTQEGLRFGGFSPEGYRSTDDYYDSFDAFLFFWPADNDNNPEVLSKVGGSGAALFDYARGGPQFGADGLLIGPPMAPVMGGFAGPDTNSGVGDLRFGRSRLGLSYAKRSDGKDSIFGDKRNATLVDVQVTYALFPLEEQRLGKGYLKNLQRSKTNIYLRSML